MIVSTLYVGGCNFRCPFCYNVDLVLNPQKLSIIPEEYILQFLGERKNFLDGICLSGGEPTIYDNLSEFLSMIKKYNLKVKLDTNGSNPKQLAEITKEGLVDFVAMDIKNCLQPEAYNQASGIKDKQVIANIRKSISIIKHSRIEYEFRTTVVPLFHDEKTIQEIAQEIKGAKQYVLQNFITTEKMLSNSLADITPYPQQKMEELKRKVKPFVGRCKVR